MRLGDVANADAAVFGKPLDGVRVLALEQMQALPWSTQLLARLGADVVKVEHPVGGESGRDSQPSILDAEGRTVGATFLRNNLNKRSIAVDFKSDAGRQLILRLAPKFDVFAENFKAGALSRSGLGYEDIAAVHPTVIYLSTSGFGGSEDSLYADWPAYASIVEAMSGIYDFMARSDEVPRANPVGALGDISAALFSTVGVLAALRHRDTTGQGQRVDIAMYDAVVAMTDIVMNFASLGRERNAFPQPFILDTFRAADGWFVVQLVREHQFERFARVVGHVEWIDDERFTTRAGWGQHLDDVLRPGVEAWASRLGKIEAANCLTAAGVAAGPCHTAREVIDDRHLRSRSMVVEMPRSDAPEHPVLVPGNPVKLSKVMEGPETRVPWLGEHTRAVLAKELDLDDDELERLESEGVIASQ
jgi:crotonobetainyl-CoA:carnitine CoA-transferase CaiB-like acyl-CoA transferase